VCYTSFWGVSCPKIYVFNRDVIDPPVIFQRRVGFYVSMTHNSLNFIYPSHYPYLSRRHLRIFSKDLIHSYRIAVKLLVLYIFLSFFLSGRHTNLLFFLSSIYGILVSVSTANVFSVRMSVCLSLSLSFFLRDVSVSCP